MDIQILRRETEADHRAVEDILPLMHTELEPAQYVRCLQQTYGIVAAWEECAFDAAPRWLQPFVLARQRRGLLERDLASFGAATPGPARPILPPMNDLPSLLGAMYVMEGSTLGGQLIARHVEATLHLGEAQGSAFFRGHGARTGQMWKDFCGLLTTHVREQQSDIVVRAAKAMFATYGAWMKEKSVMDAS